MHVQVVHTPSSINSKFSLLSSITTFPLSSNINYPFTISRKQYLYILLCINNKNLFSIPLVIDKFFTNPFYRIFLNISISFDRKEKKSIFNSQLIYQHFMFLYVPIGHFLIHYSSYHPNVLFQFQFYQLYIMFSHFPTLCVPFLSANHPSTNSHISCQNLCIYSHIHYRTLFSIILIINTYFTTCFYEPTRSSHFINHSFPILFSPLTLLRLTTVLSQIIFSQPISALSMLHPHF